MWFYIPENSNTKSKIFSHRKVNNSIMISTKIPLIYEVELFQGI